MQIQTILFLIAAAFVAIGIVLFQYYYKNKKRGKRIVLLSFLRFTALFSLFLLLINPKFVKTEYVLEKTNLVVVADNSSSMAANSAELVAFLDQIKSNKTLTDKFKIDYYRFGNQFQALDSLSFFETNTNIAKALKSVSGIYNQKNTVGVLLSDGNQTIGQDYEFYGDKINIPFYSVVFGDTTKYEDIKINQVNTNKFAFLKNKFPIECYIAYDGEKNVSVPVSITVDGKTVFKEQVQFSNDIQSKRIHTFLNADAIGVKTIDITVGALKNERNIINNRKSIAVEVIDEKTNVTIVSAVMHPDLGALKKAIETNEQRSVTIVKPSVSKEILEETDVFICYQPDVNFKAVYSFIMDSYSNYFTVVGTKTDLNFLNSLGLGYRIETGYPIQEVLGKVNPSFSKYDISSSDFTDYPPLTSNSGAITFSGTHDALLQRNIRGVDLNNPLLAISENKGQKTAVLLGENIWKWRLKNYVNLENFENFDTFLGKLMLYLSNNTKKERLSIDYKSVYENLGLAKVTATYSDETYVFDAKANLFIQIAGGVKIPMLLKTNYFEADLSDLKPGTYSFKIGVEGKSILKSGKFTVLDYDVEQQFFSSNYQKMENFSTATNASLLYPNQFTQLLKVLDADKRFLPTQKSVENVVSLIDFKILLGLIIIALSLEWFIRKYNGLI
ncbi:VWA domain-containing protein [Cellulophaga sp. L1A9]|uniref:VWA domain-containing protein n=1 Tax=Cellulophaga sp. L1A9 TaxID=2686362 RepID=UPI00131E54C5|nr:VWA domain-containing protein [Cellulophaga sp. L1A9]